MKGKNCQQLNEIHIYFWIIGKRVKIDNFKNIIMKRVLCRQFRNTYVEMCLFLRFEIEQTSSEVSILKNRRYNINVEPSRAPQKKQLGSYIGDETYLLFNRWNDRVPMVVVGVAVCS